MKYIYNRYRPYYNVREREWVKVFGMRKVQCKEIMNKKPMSQSDGKIVLNKDIQANSEINQRYKV